MICPVCKGSGKNKIDLLVFLIAHYPSYEDCEECDGTGYVCRRCNAPMSGSEDFCASCEKKMEDNNEIR